MVFKIDVFFVPLKEEIPNLSVSEILGSPPLKTFSSMLRMLLRKINLSSEKDNEQWFQCLSHSKKLDLSNLGNYVRIHGPLDELNLT